MGKMWVMNFNSVYVCARVCVCSCVRAHTLTAVGSWLKALRPSNKGLLLLAIVAAIWQSVIPLEWKLRSGGQEISRLSRNVYIHTMFTRAHRQSFESLVPFQNYLRSILILLSQLPPPIPNRYVTIKVAVCSSHLCSAVSILIWSR
jgi:hypothetical protein